MVALFGLAFATASDQRPLTLQRNVTRRVIMQKARRHAEYRSIHRASTVCRHTVSGTISLPLKGCFSPFPHGTGSLSVAREYLALEGGPPGFRRDFSCPALLGNILTIVVAYAYRALTFCGWLFQVPFGFTTFPGGRTNLLPKYIPQHRLSKAVRLEQIIGLGCSAFARRY